MLTQKRINTIVKILSCVREYGVLQGTFILSKLYGKSEIIIQLPEYRGPIRLRSLREDVSDVSVFDKVFIQKEYDIPGINITPKLIIDGGANIGCSTIFFANKYPEARIVSVEPDHSNYNRLIENSGMYNNIIPINAALWSKKTWLKIKNYEYGHMALQVEEMDHPEEGAIPSLTITDLLEFVNLDYIDILKLDIECAEKQVFEENSSAWLDKVGIIILELHDWIKPGCATAFYHALSGYEFQQFIYGENIVVIK